MRMRRSSKRQGTQRALRPVSASSTYPGHERFVPTMLMGAAGIDYALLVVAADDGVMPQTREHLAILHLLGIERGALALSKCDRASPARVAEVEAQIASLLARPPARRQSDLRPVRP